MPVGLHACSDRSLRVESSDDTPLPQVVFSSAPALSQDEAMKREDTQGRSTELIGSSQTRGLMRAPISTLSMTKKREGNNEHLA